MGRLPATKTKPKTDLSQMIVLLYGPPKIGKSTWASTAPGAIFVATEAGLGQLSVYSITSEGSDCCESWDDVVLGVNELLTHAKATKPAEDTYQTVVIDTVEELVDLAATHVISQHNQKAERKAEHISDIPYGKGYAALWRECKGLISKIARSRYGLVLICHAFTVTEEDTTGEYTKTVPSLSGKLRGQVEAVADLILLADTVTEGKGHEERVIFTKPSKYHTAGDRTGKLPARLPLSFEAVADALRDEVRSWGVAVYQKACSHPGLPDKASVMSALTSVVQVALGKVGDEAVTFDLDFLRTLDNETRGKISDMVDAEVNEALEVAAEAETASEAEPEGQPEAEPTDDTPEKKEPEAEPEAPEKPKGKGGKKASTKKATKTANKKAKPKAQPKDEDEQEEEPETEPSQDPTFEYSDQDGPTPFD